MATSGTLGTTTVDTGKLIEHAVRRCGLPAQTITAEVAEIARDNLFLILLNLSNRGINLWCVDEKLIATVAGQSRYLMPAGTIDILNLLYSTPTLATGTDATTATTYTTTLTADSDVVRYAFTLPSAVASSTFYFESSPDGATWTTVDTQAATSWAAGTYWYKLTTTPNETYYRVRCSISATISAISLAASVSDLPMSALNRDEYANQTNKATQSLTSTNYYFEKLVDPQFAAWPVPSVSTNHFTLYRHRQIQDVGTLMQSIELPMRWMESIIWQLAARLSFEIPSVAPDRLAAVQQMAERYLLDAEGNETDHAPVYFAPRIGVYTR